MSEGFPELAATGPLAQPTIADPITSHLPPSHLPRVTSATISAWLRLTPTPTPHPLPPQPPPPPAPSPPPHFTPPHPPSFHFHDVGNFNFLEDGDGLKVWGGNSLRGVVPAAGMCRRALTCRTRLPTRAAPHPPPPTHPRAALS